MARPSGTAERPQPLFESKDGPSSPGRIVRIIGVVGRVFVALGLLLLFYTVYLLWGTSVFTKQAQSDLARELAADPLVTNEAVTSGDIPPARPTEPPAPGQGLFTMAIPKIGLKQVVVSGVGREELKKGPGLFRDCAESPKGDACIEGGSPYPGEDGNVAMSGHRTTYGAPFFKLNELEPGDVIDIESGPARYRYRVREAVIVRPTDVQVIENHGVNELTLTTCHPRFSAAQRLIVHADYEGPSLIAPAAAPRPTGSDAAPAEDPRLVPSDRSLVPTDVLVLGSIALAAAIAAMGLSDRLRKASIYTSAVIVAAAGLWVFVFPQILQLMPANY